MRPWLKLVVCILIPLGVGALASFFTATGVSTWYRTIARPDWNPPDVVFAPVWTTLYILMGVALYLIWRKEVLESLKRSAIGWWVVQLVLNALWSFLFFSLQTIGLALIEIIVLWFAILGTIFSFARISKMAAWLLVPYISWVTFATILTFAIWRLNS